MNHAVSLWVVGNECAFGENFVYNFENTFVVHLSTLFFFHILPLCLCHLINWHAAALTIYFKFYVVAHKIQCILNPIVYICNIGHAAMRRGT